MIMARLCHKTVSNLTVIAAGFVFWPLPQPTSKSKDAILVFKFFF